MSTPHIYTDETLALIEQATRDIAAEQADRPHGNRLSPNMYWPAASERATDTSAADNFQLAGIFAHLHANQKAAEQAQTTDPQWAGPSLPHPTEAASDEERAELAEGWDNWQHGIDPNQIHEGHYTEEAGI